MREELEPMLDSVDDAMRSLDMSRSELYRKMKDGTLASVKRGRRRLIVYASLKALAQKDIA